MTISEVVKIARIDSNILFTRKFYMETGFNPKKDVYRVNIKGRINHAFKEYDPYNSVTFHTDHLAAEDWVIVNKDEIQRTNQETNTADVEKAFEEYIEKNLTVEDGMIKVMRQTMSGVRNIGVSLGTFEDCFTAGARSRDKEVSALKNETESLAKELTLSQARNFECRGEIEQLKDQLREAVKVLGSFDEYRSASDRGETSKTQWHTFERILYDRTRQFLTKHHLKVRKRDE